MLDNGLVEQQNAQDAVGRALLQMLPDGAERAVLNMTVLTVTSMGYIDAFYPDKTIKHVKFGGRFNTDLVRSLREVMYRPDSGTWFSMEMTVTSTGAMTARFNYDNEPEWDVPVDPVSYVNDAKKFPRDEAHQPVWLQQRLAEGQARIDGQR